MAKFTDKKLLPHYENAKILVEKLSEQSKLIHNEETQAAIQELKLRIGEPFLFVIVGEVKAGKSSFINGLLDTQEEICAVAPDPKTDVIQQIKFGENFDEIQINEFLKQVYYPDPILKEISIVDTPGTNTIISHHQEITERFVPVADLVVFVFEAKNPYRRSAWEFLDYIRKDWKKKVIFILQQKDLLREADLKTNTEGVIRQAKEKGITDPVVFAVSALQELEGEKETSGYIPLRDYIQKNVTGKNAFLLKLENILQLVGTINDKIYSGLLDRKAQFESDQAFRKLIDQNLEEHISSSKKQVTTLIRNLLTGYDKATLISEKELKEGLSFSRLVGKSFKSIFNKKESPKYWLEEIKSNLERNLKIEMTDHLPGAVNDLADHIHNMAKVVELEILKNKTILKDNNELFGHIAERRRRIIEELQSSFRDFIEDPDTFANTRLVEESESISPNIATGSGLAVIGVILAAVAKGAVFDISGGLITTLGLLFAGITTGIKRKKILRRFHEEVGLTRTKINVELSDKLEEYVLQIKDKIEGQFDDFDAMLEKEAFELDRMEANYHFIQDEKEALKGKLKR